MESEEECGGMLYGMDPFSINPAFFGSCYPEGRRRKTVRVGIGHARPSYSVRGKPPIPPTFPSLSSPSP